MRRDAAIIVVFGSINVDISIAVQRLPRVGETVLGPGYVLTPGGKGANQALAAKRASAAGSAVHFIGVTGTDTFADIALRDLRAGNVDLTLVARNDRPTGCAVICVDPSGHNMIAVASGANLSLAASQAPDSLLGQADILILQMETPLEENWSLVSRAKEHGMRVLLNAAPADAIPVSVMRALDWLIVNEGEIMDLARYFHLEADTPRRAGQAIAVWASITVIVTLGDEGAVAYSGQGGAVVSAWRTGVLPIIPHDTVGAGDAFTGAFAVAMQDGLSLPQAMVFASAAAGLACERLGAQQSFPMRAAIMVACDKIPLAQDIPSFGA